MGHCKGPVHSHGCCCCCCCYWVLTMTHTPERTPEQSASPCQRHDLLECIECPVLHQDVQKCQSELLIGLNSQCSIVWVAWQQSGHVESWLLPLHAHAVVWMTYDVMHQNISLLVAGGTWQRDVMLTLSVQGRSAPLRTMTPTTLTLTVTALVRVGTWQLLQSSWRAAVSEV